LHPSSTRGSLIQPNIANNLAGRKQFNLPYLLDATFGHGGDKVLRRGTGEKPPLQTWIANWWLTTFVRLPPEK